MRRLSLALLGAAALLSSVQAQEAGNSAADPQQKTFVFTPGLPDAAGHFIGGTELRVLAAHAGKLYAGNGYWQDRPGPEGPQGAEILVADGPAAPLRVDHVFDEQMPNGRPRNIAVAALREITFATDGAGKALAAPVSMMVASTWDLTGEVKVYSRDDASNNWSATTLANDRRAPGAFIPQVRAFSMHRDRVTGTDLAFAGDDPHGVFAGAYDAAVPGRIRWSGAPELDISGLSQAEFAGMAGRVRISSFAECNGALYAAVGQQIYQRVDGPEPHWRLLYSNPRPGRSESGLRGLTAAPGPGGRKDVLIAAVEGSASRIVRVDPDDGDEATEVDLQAFVGKAWGMRVGYTIAAYNDMARVRDPKGKELLLMGIEAFIPPEAPLAAGHSVVDVGYGRLESGAWYLIRRPSGDYDLRQVPARPGQPMVATRAILASPFADDEPAVYFAGYDANKAPAHNTAWMVRSTLAAAVGAPN